MASHHYKEQIEQILTPLDIRVNGDRPWDIQMHNPQTYQRILSGGMRCSLPLGESYMDGWWDVPALDQFFEKLTKKKPTLKKSPLQFFLPFISSLFFNGQNKTLSRRVAEQHYDLGNIFYQSMLDPYMQYTCGYFPHGDETLDQAQKNKLDLICKKIDLPLKNSLQGKSVIELGSGFGGFAKFSTEHYHCSVNCYNISEEQITFSREFTRGLPVQIRAIDYRDAQYFEQKNSADTVVSIGLCEHVGGKNYKNLMETAHHCLKNEGLFLLHTIGRHTSASSVCADSWITRYIFPGGHLPSAQQIYHAAEGYFRSEDMQNFGHDYDRTLMAWCTNFDYAWPSLNESMGERLYDGMQKTHLGWPSFSDDEGARFNRMWRYYLLSCAGAFRSGSINLFQFVFSKGNSSKKYSFAR